jgi:hypothetical protein
MRVDIAKRSAETHVDARELSGMVFGSMSEDALLGTRLDA